MTVRLCACGHSKDGHLDMGAGQCDAALYCECPAFKLAPWSGRCASCDATLLAGELAVCRGCLDEPIRVRHVVIAAVIVIALVMAGLAC